MHIRHAYIRVGMFMALLLAMLGLPHSTFAAVADGSLVTSPSHPSVYLVEGGLRRPFPNEQVYKTWYKDFSKVQRISVASLEEIPLGTPMSPKPGVRMLKFPFNPKVYQVVDDGKTIRHIPDEETARALFGSGWNTFIIELPEVYSLFYTKGAALDHVSTTVQTPKESSTQTDAEQTDDSATPSTPTQDTSSDDTATHVAPGEPLYTVCDVLGRPTDTACDTSADGTAYVVDFSTHESYAPIGEQRDLGVFEFFSRRDAVLTSLRVTLRGTTTVLNELSLYSGNTLVQTVRRSGDAFSFSNVQIVSNAQARTRLTLRGTIVATTGDNLPFALGLQSMSAVYRSTGSAVSIYIPADLDETKTIYTWNQQSTSDDTTSQTEANETPVVSLSLGALDDTTVRYGEKSSLLFLLNHESGADVALARMNLTFSFDYTPDPTMTDVSFLSLPYSILDATGAVVYKGKIDAANETGNTVTLYASPALTLRRLTSHARNQFTVVPDFSKFSVLTGMTHIDTTVSDIVVEKTDRSERVSVDGSVRQRLYAYSSDML